MTVMKAKRSQAKCRSSQDRARRHNIKSRLLAYQASMTRIRHRKSPS
jgi:hypothetical protein